MNEDFNSRSDEEIIYDHSTFHIDENTKYCGLIGSIGSMGAAAALGLSALIAGGCGAFDEGDKTDPDSPYNRPALNVSDGSPPQP